MTKQDELVTKLSTSLSMQGKWVRNIIELLEEGNTVPFISRYRKEQTGSADEVQIKNVQDGWEYTRQMQQRKEEVSRLIEEQDKLTPEIRESIAAAEKLQELEDIYRPYRQKRKTRATAAVARGLEPLASYLFALPKEGSPEEEAKAYVFEEKDVENVEAALQGARDIIAEWVSDNPSLRKELREQSFRHGLLFSKQKKGAVDEAGTYEMYYEYQEAVRKVPSHRILAMNRGEKDKVVKVSVSIEEERALQMIEKKIVKRYGSPALEQVKAAYEDAYKRLIAPSIEREIRNELTAKAEEQAIHIFSENLKQLLLQPPMKGKVVLGLDPAYRTGCKIAVVDENGKLLHVGVIYPVPPVNKVGESRKVLKGLLNKYSVEVIAIGNGTASRETEEFVAEAITEWDHDAAYLIVNEAGASIYSASEVGREEFGDLSVEQRSGVSIARRLQDPLAELVKIDPKSVGVGQYQHDVTQSKLNDSLTFVVETTVNKVGVNVNTASPSLLKYVSGLSKAVAGNIIKYREENGSFTSRAELKKVPRLGSKAYEQAAGFMRIIDGKEPLDKTAIHPESYKTAKALLASIDASAAEAGSAELIEKLSGLSIKESAEALDAGEPTIRDIIEDLKRPLRDPREDLPKPILKKGIMRMEDLEEGMELQGTVRNVVDFGAFVDIGVKQDGLVHISKMAKRFIKHPMEAVSIGDIIPVWIDSVDSKKGRIALTMIEPNK